MPALSPTMESGTIAGWSCAEGDEVAAGEVYAQIETDKATVDFEATDDGVVARILVDAGSQDVAVGTPLLVLVDDPEDVAAFANYSASGSSQEGASATTPIAPSTSAAPATPAAPAAAIQHVAVVTKKGDGSRIFVSPLAKMMAKEKGLDLSQISGTGPQGRIIKADILSYKPAQASATQAVQPSKALQPVGEGVGYVDVPNSQIRKVIASRLTMSKSTIPHYYLSMDIKMDNLMKVRKTINEQSETKISVNDFIIKASAAAMADVPSVNAQWSDEAVRMFDNVDVCVAVATPHGLLTPVVTDVAARGLASISTQVRDMATRARDMKLTPAELSGGTFTISNLGMFGISHFCAVINPPQAAILAVGATQQKVVPDGEGFGVENNMTVTLSCDHRVVDGAVAATWLQAFKKYMEQPVTMIC